MAKIERYHLGVADSSPVISLGLSQVLRRIDRLYIDVTVLESQADLRKLLMQNKLDLLIINPTFGGVFDPLKCKREAENPDLKIFAIELGKLNSQTVELYDGVINITDSIEEISKKIRITLQNDPAVKEEKESLSTREKEIVSLVVKGLTNQEIADKLFLSIHTVITHRRNIARKLEIHSATGLTIYAIVNKIVNIEDVVH